MSTDRMFDAGGGTGRGVAVAVIDSGVHASHPHVGGVDGGAGFDTEGHRSDDYVDRIGHGTAVMAAIKEKAPDAELFAVRIFERTLRTSLATLLAGLQWAIDADIRIVNLSLGTANPGHSEALRQVVERAVDRGVVIVAASDEDGTQWFPGSLPGVVPVQVDWNCPREICRVADTERGRVFRASGYPRTIPGVPPDRNLSGISFAVANVSGLMARFLEGRPGATAQDVLQYS